MLEKYEGIRELKLEIKKFLALIDENNDIPNKSKLTNIIKLIIFNKKIFNDLENENKYYIKCMIYNLLMILNSLKNNSILYFYYCYRSYIENYFRVMLYLKDDDVTGVNNLINQFTEKYNQDERMVEITTFIKGEYGKACDFVHSNRKADLPIYEYYKDILDSNELSNKKIEKLISQLKSLLRYTTELLIMTRYEDIYSSFYRKKVDLKFLIGDKLMETYDEKLKLVII
ncbi:hypothetical protein [Clostridium perfringens]|uniref:hypothetical protein n=1 Tax=Clostridium perfringens TaxID=1502 RepID=UPI001F06DEC6|nr:hypothetical protein [Clostridium perfringens]